MKVLFNIHVLARRITQKIRNTSRQQAVYTYMFTCTLSRGKQEETTAQNLMFVILYLHQQVQSKGFFPSTTDGQGSYLSISVVRAWTAVR